MVPRLLPDMPKMTSTLEGRKDPESSLVSVVIPCYNHAHFLADAIDSVMAQTWRDFEIIVVDDGSRDNTFQVASRYESVRYVHQQNKGLSASRNTGLRQSKGDYLVFLDADDRLLPSALETGVHFLKTYPQCAFVAGRCQLVARDGTPLTDLSPASADANKAGYPALLRDTFIWNPASVMYRRRVFESLSPFDVSLNAAEDWDLYLRIAREHSIYSYDSVIVEYRQHTANMSRNAALMLEATYTVLHSQRRYIKSHPEYKMAYRQGIQLVQNAYGSLLVDEVLSQVKNRCWKQAAIGVLTILRYYPYGFWQCLYRGVSKTAIAFSARNMS
jgi:glycosyltransferase involved in cell wall biosynthesis